MYVMHRANPPDAEDLQIEVLFNAASWAGRTCKNVKFSSHGVSFLLDSNLFYVPHPIPYQDLSQRAIALAENVRSFGVVEKDEALYFVLLLTSDEIGVCVLEEIWDVIAPTTRSPFLNNFYQQNQDAAGDTSQQSQAPSGKVWANADDFVQDSSLKLRLLHPLASTREMDLYISEASHPTVTFVSDVNLIVLESHLCVTVLRYDADCSQDQQALNLLFSNKSLENTWIAKLMGPSASESLMFAIWKSTAGDVTLICRNGLSSQLSALNLAAWEKVTDDSVWDSMRESLSTPHRSQISAVSSAHDWCCDYALSGDIDGRVVLWKYHFRNRDDELRASSDEDSRTRSCESKVVGQWSLVLDEAAFCEGQQVTMLHIDPRNLYAYVGDTSGRLSIAQISVKSNRLHVVHDLVLFPASHGPSAVFIAPPSSLPTASLSASYVYGGDNESVSSKRDLKAVLVQCFCDSTREAVQVRLAKGIASVVRVGACAVLPCDRGNHKLRSLRPDGHNTFPVQDAATVGSKVIDCSLVLPALNAVVTVDWLGVLQLWDVVTGALLHQNMLPSHHVTCLASSDGRCWRQEKRVMLCSGHRTGAVHAVSLTVDARFATAAPLALAESVAEGSFHDIDVVDAVAKEAELPVFDLLREEDSDGGGDDDGDDPDADDDDAGDADDASQPAASDADNGPLAPAGEAGGRALGEGSVASAAGESLAAMSNWSLQGSLRKTRDTSTANQLPLLWNVEQSARASRLPATDVFWSDFGLQFVALHGRRELHLFETYAAAADETLPPPAEEPARPTGGIAAAGDEPLGERRRTAKKTDATGAAAPRATPRATGHRAAQPRSGATARGDSSNPPTARSRQSQKSATPPAAATSAATDDESDAGSLGSSVSSQPPLELGALRNATATAAKRPSRSMTLPFAPLHVTLLQRQPSDSDSSGGRTRHGSSADDAEYASAASREDRLWLVLQKARDVIVIFDALKMEFMTEVQLSPAGQEVQLSVTWVWDYIDHASLQCVLMGLCAHSIDEWFEFNEVDGLKPVASSAANQGGSFHQSTYSQVKSASQVFEEQAATADDHNDDAVVGPSFSSASLGVSSMPSTMVSKAPASLLQSFILGAETYRAGEAPIVVAWSQKSCMLVRLQLVEGNRVTVTRKKRYDLTSTGLLRHAVRNRVHFLTGKALATSTHIRNHRVVVVLSNGFAVVLHL